MAFDLPHLTYSGPAIDDPGTLARLPLALATGLQRRNGYIAYRGVFHVRGACASPPWHSLQAAWDGPEAYHRLYPDVQAGDIPFAEEAFGDQFLLRGPDVWRLEAETGGLRRVSASLDAFFSQLLNQPDDVLGYDHHGAVAAAGGPLPPGTLLSVYPPFVLNTGDQPRSYRVIPTADRRGSLASLAQQIRDLPDGAYIHIKPTD